MPTLLLHASLLQWTESSTGCTYITNDPAMTQVLAAGWVIDGVGQFTSGTPPEPPATPAGSDVAHGAEEAGLQAGRGSVGDGLVRAASYQSGLREVGSASGVVQGSGAAAHSTVVVLTRAQYMHVCYWGLAHEKPQPMGSGTKPELLHAGFVVTAWPAGEEALPGLFVVGWKTLHNKINKQLMPM